MTANAFAKRLHEELLRRGVTLVAVTKNQTLARLTPLYDAGLRDFGENRVQELLEKRAAFPDDVRWHLVGHLQTNKVKAIAPFVHLVHSIDSEKVLAELNHQGVAYDRVIDFLLQLHVAEEETKYGLRDNELIQLSSADVLSKYPNVRLRGLMAMATNTDNEQQVRGEFAKAHGAYQAMRQRLGGYANAKVDTLSMGMSGDYELAIECGSNMLRIGSLLFGG